MEYRNLPHGGEPISILGLGSSALGPSGDKEIQATAALAVENGINYFDLASADAVPFTAYGKALGSVRDKVYYQIHFGADYQTGQYGWTLDLEEIKRVAIGELGMTYAKEGQIITYTAEGDDSMRKVSESGN